MTRPTGDGRSPLSVGDRVVLTRAVGPVPRGSKGTVLGFLRRDIDLLVVSFDDAATLHLRQEDVAAGPAAS